MHFDSNKKEVLLDPAVIDAGFVYESDDLNFHARLVNMSKKFINITGVEKSCACTDISLSKLDVAPGQASNIAVKIMPAKHADGFKATANITWKDKDSISGSVLLTLMGGIRHFITVNPEFYNFGTVQSQGKSMYATFHVKRGTADTPWDSIRATSPRMATSVKKLTDDQFDIETVLDLSSNLVGQIGERVQIELLNKGEPIGYKSNVNVLAHIIGDLEAKPSFLYLGSNRLGNSTTGRFDVVGNNSIVKVVDVQSNHPSVVAKYNRAEGGKIEFSYVFDCKTVGDISGKLLISVLAPDQRVVEVPFIGHVSPPE